ncbi:hypothetical protein K435DRAFT_388534 [Dendrothele bispora CBS 962.96]|uniref:NADH dehydrogenase [ubiquinone] 1 beta subcomplex subunit 4 n=1 Tax=Dendrothele bispora (strain CBS 962.96) TaxID=1314807 RepID=A0A4S8MGC8_DENBC|nr:hypothetical protein K435DRAFT_855792 [Dendrothele bispora CBS 962.96]THV01723.1 hypothetical protein K435DRAFT_388534 [Dendrothele bispora CBS 962.96]
MGGHAHGSFKPDPAVENFNTWREQHYLRFRWTRPNVKVAILGFIVAPVTLYAITHATTDRWAWNGKLKDSTLSKSN